MKYFRTSSEFVLLWACLITPVQVRVVQVDCPKYCECDIFENLKRAVCQDKKLITIDLNIPGQVQILDVSQNRISELGDKVFLDLGLVNLKLLNISQNAIGQIHLNAFEGMDKLKTLDLSFNAIEYLTQSWFDSWLSLEELYLRGNKLRSINNQPRIGVKSLKLLDLSNCGINSLKTDIFQLIPNLEVLDISDNDIQVVNVELLQMLPKLQEFKTNGNDFNCIEKNMSAVGSYTKAHRIAYMDPCTENFPTLVTINQGVHKFEKIIMGNDGSVESTTAISARKNSWIFEVDDEENNRTVVVNTCQNKTEGAVLDDEDEDESLLMTIIKLSPWMVVAIIFIYGVLFGMVITCCINLCRNPKERRKPKKVKTANINCRAKNKLHRSNSVLYRKIQKSRMGQFQHRELEDADSGDETLVMHEFDLPNSTPVFIRKVAT